MASASPEILARVDGWGVTALNLSTAVDAIIARARAGDAFAVFTLNLDHLVKLRTNKRFADAYRQAEIVTADGWPIVLLARAQASGVERATGADLIQPLSEAAAKARIPVFLFGASADVMAKAGRELGHLTDGAIDIAGTLAPSANFDPEGPEADAAIARIRASGARLCYVALGAPKQEIFSAYARRKGLACGMIGIGAALDFLAGTQVRAPKFFRDIGLEWLWRLGANPKRLAKRYADCALLFADLAIAEPLRRRLARPA